MTAEPDDAQVLPLRERNKARTRNDIAVAALALMEAQGYESTTVEQIARRAGVSSATFFRNFPSKEDVLFVGEQPAEQITTELVAGRKDRSQTLMALAEPVAAMAAAVSDVTGQDSHQLTRLVMTTKSLEGRSMRMRLRWERAIARQLAHEHGLDEPAAEQVLLGNLAIACLAAALWCWNRHDTSLVSDETMAAFRSAAQLCAGTSGA
ncbi:TetR/AcrR family transcriptional regulator [Mycobacterium sp.]|uniref:TetR/AcrR family transcriptional regulator n=1 Tax=Mycobacterium sp. TaxID=1785 RepID=UPI003D14D6CC